MRSHINKSTIGKASTATAALLAVSGAFTFTSTQVSTDPAVVGAASAVRLQGKQRKDEKKKNKKKGDSSDEDKDITGIQDQMTDLNLQGSSDSSEDNSGKQQKVKINPASKTNGGFKSSTHDNSEKKNYSKNLLEHAKCKILGKMMKEVCYKIDVDDPNLCKIILIDKKDVWKGLKGVKTPKDLNLCSMNLHNDIVRKQQMYKQYGCTDVIHINSSGPEQQQTAQQKVAQARDDLYYLANPGHAFGPYVGNVENYGVVFQWNNMIINEKQQAQAELDRYLQACGKPNFVPEVDHIASPDLEALDRLKNQYAAQYIPLKNRLASVSLQNPNQPYGLEAQAAQEDLRVLVLKYTLAQENVLRVTKYERDQRDLQDKLQQMTLEKVGQPVQKNMIQMMMKKDYDSDDDDLYA